MARGSLPPTLAAMARAEGAEAARDVLAGRVPKPCRWDANAGSITRARLAAAWSEAFLSVKPMPTGDLPE